MIGQTMDCSGDGDCCPQSWIGDGFGDCVDQAFGCDLHVTIMMVEMVL